MSHPFKIKLAPFTPTDDHQDWRGGLSGKYMPEALAKEILPSLDGPHLFMYLFRRFGPPSWPWNQTHYLVQYVLSTPLAGVYLTVIPDMQRCMFGYLLAPERAAVAYSTPADTWPTAPLYKEGNEAFRTALADLLRPVWLHDQAINATGIVTNCLAGMLIPVSPAKVYPKVVRLKGYGPYITALKERGIDMSLVQTGGGCVALWMRANDDSDIYTLGPFIDDRYNGFEVISEENPSMITTYEPLENAHVDLGPVETAALLAPALHRYLTGDKAPLPGWQCQQH